MAENSAADALKNLLGSDADEKIKAVMSSLTSGSNSSGSASGQSEAGGITPLNTEKLLGGINSSSLEYIGKIKSILDEMGSSNSDARTNLLLSLKPYMRTNRQSSIDSAVKLLNLSKIGQLLK